MKKLQSMAKWLHEEKSSLKEYLSEREQVKLVMVLDEMRSENNDGNCIIESLTEARRGNKDSALTRLILTKTRKLLIQNRKLVQLMKNADTDAKRNEINALMQELSSKLTVIDISATLGVRELINVI